jgi:hypothetical protein
MPEDLFVNALGSYGKEMLTSGTASEMVYHPLSAAYDWLFNIFRATLHPQPEDMTHWGQKPPK